MAVHTWCHVGVSWRYVMVGICHGGMSWQFRGFLYVMRYVMACYVMAIDVYVMHVSDMSLGMSCRCVMYICHGDMSLNFRICHVGMSSLGSSH